MKFATVTLSPIMRTRPQPVSRRNPHGFTIIELLMVLAILILGVGLFVVNIDNAIEGVNRQSPTEVMLQSFRQARLLAVTDKRPVFLSFEPDLGRFELRTGEPFLSQAVAVFELDSADKDFIEAVYFWPIEPWLETQTRRDSDGFVPLPEALPAVRFEPTGISNFIAVQWQYAPSVSEPVWMLMDPFSSAVLEGEVL